MKVKICGITREEDAAAAVRAGADALGFIFVRSSTRWIDPEKARTIIEGMPSHVTPVGVFVNAPRREISEVADKTGIRLLQLHGDEPPAEILGFAVPVWKAFRVKPGFDVATLGMYRADGFLLDAFVEGMNGGTGEQFNWDIAVSAKQFGRIILSGGITPDNVVAAVRKVDPYAIDVSSGVETSPGLKDPAKIQRLFAALELCRSKESSC